MKPSDVQLEIRIEMGQWTITSTYDKTNKTIYFCILILYILRFYTLDFKAFLLLSIGHVMDMLAYLKLNKRMV